MYRVHGILEQLTLSHKKIINFELSFFSMMLKEKCAKSVLLKQWIEGDATLTIDGKVVICQVCNKNVGGVLSVI